MGKKVSLVVHDLGSNPIVRAAPFGKALISLGYEVEIVGFSYSYNDPLIYEPYKDEFTYKVIRCPNDIRWVIIKSFALSKLISGDYVYVFKPKWTTLFPALISSFCGLRKRIIQDAEDNELWDSGIGNGFRSIIKSPYYVENPVYNKVLHPLTFLISRKTIVSQSLKRRYGGKIVLHGPDEKFFNPNLYTKPIELIRNDFQLPGDKKLMLFAGKPTKHKGIDIICETIKSQKCHGWDLVLAGNPDAQEFKQIKAELGSRCHLIGFIEHQKMPLLLKAVDLIPILQVKTRFSEMQIPAKLLEAMSMEKVIISTNVSDIGELLAPTNSPPRGWILNESTSQEFINTLRAIESDFEDAIERAKEGLKFYRENASKAAIAERIKPYFD